MRMDVQVGTRSGLLLGRIRLPREDLYAKGIERRSMQQVDRLSEYELWQILRPHRPFSD